MESKERGIEYKLTNDVQEIQKEYDDLVEGIKTSEKRKMELEETLNSLKKTLQFYLTKSSKEKKDATPITSEYANIRSAREAII